MSGSPGGKHRGGSAAVPSHHAPARAARLPTLLWLSGAGLFAVALAWTAIQPRSTPAAPPAATPTTAGTSARTAASGSPTTVVSQIDSVVGLVATDAAGRTLYRFDRDSSRPPRTRCVDACAATWPPLLLEGRPVPGRGVDGALLGSVTRPDGSRQVTLHGWPLYRYAGDTRPGDATGEGVNGAWHAIGPDGGLAIRQGVVGAAPYVRVAP